MTISTRPAPTVVPIAEVDRQTALQFAQQQPTREKATQVYRNTLAVLAAQRCLSLLEIPTDVGAGDCWNSFSQMAADLADLCVTGLGSLECRPVSRDEHFCAVPPEVWADRIGYLVVQLDPPYREASLLGFLPQVDRASLDLNHLHPLEELLVHLELLQAQQASILAITHLSQWLDGLTDRGDRAWQTVETLLGTWQPAFAFRTFGEAALGGPERIQQMVEQLYASQQLGYPPVVPSEPKFKSALEHLIQTTADEEARWKAAELLWTIDPGNLAAGVRRVLDLGVMLAGRSMGLMVAILQVGAGLERRISLLARVYPMDEPAHLPEGLQLAVLGPDGRVGLETQARQRDNYIQLKLRGEFGEQFSIRLCLDQDVITEYFVI